jgi:hypothetical protein
MNSAFPQLEAHIRVPQWAQAHTFRKTKPDRRSIPVDQEVLQFVPGRSTPAKQSAGPSARTNTSLGAKPQPTVWPGPQGQDSSYLSLRSTHRRMVYVGSHGQGNFFRGEGPGQFFDAYLFPGVPPGLDNRLDIRPALTPLQGRSHGRLSSLVRRARTVRRSIASGVKPRQIAGGRDPYRHCLNARIIQ